MGKEREGDVRVHLIIWLFFACIVGGGVFLCLYFFLPETESADWHYLVGIGLVAVPWVFWFLMYLYTCFKPRPNDPNRAAAAPATPSPGADDEGHFQHEVAVTVEDDRGGLEEEGESGHHGPCRVSNDVEFGSRESEMPLKIGGANSSCVNK